MVPFRLLAVPLGPGQGCQVEGQRGEDEGAEVEVEGGDEEGDGDGDVGRHGDQLEDEEPEEAAQGAGATVHDPKHRPGLLGPKLLLVMGCVKLGEKNCVHLPAVGEQNAN